jgi:hypothetical protein
MPCWIMKRWSITRSVIDVWCLKTADMAGFAVRHPDQPSLDGKRRWRWVTGIPSAEDRPPLSRTNERADPLLVCEGEGIGFQARSARAERAVDIARAAQD